MTDGGDDALDKAWRDLLEKDVLQFARVACAYAPDSMPQRINEAVEDAGYTFQKLIELAKNRDNIRGRARRTSGQGAIAVNPYCRLFA